MTIQKIGAVLTAVGTMFLSSTAEASDDGNDGFVVTRPTPDGGRPVVARTDASGDVHLQYDSDDGPMYARSCDGGATFAAPIAVVAPAPLTSGLEYAAWDMAVGKGGRVHVALGTNAWKLKLPEAEWGFFYANLDPGSTTFSPARNINRKPSEGFSLAANDKGDVTACWLSDKLYANVSHDRGETFEPTVELDPSYNPCNCCTTSTVYGADGRLAVLYREETNNDRDMYVVLWDQERGRTSRTRVGTTSWKVDGCPMTYFAITRDRDGFKAIWPTMGRIDFARLNGEGVASGPAEIPTPGRSGMRTGMLALSDPDGRTLAAWRSGDEIGWQLYDIDGLPLGRPGSAKSSGKGVAGVVGEGGRFVLFR